MDVACRLYLCVPSTGNKEGSMGIMAFTNSVPDQHSVFPGVCDAGGAVENERLEMGFPSIGTEKLLHCGFLVVRFLPVG